MNKIQICIIQLLMSSFISCQALDTHKKQTGKKEVNESESFNNFYKKFHKDSLFQISRIKFPLRGINSDEMTVEDTTYIWRKEEWLMQHVIDTTLFNIKVIISDTIVEEEVTSKDPGVFVKRKFQYMKGKWFLVLYEDVSL